MGYSWSRGLQIIN